MASAVSRRWHWLLPAGVIAVLMAPMVLTDRTFGGDWPGHLWLVQMQARNISYLGHPSLFVQSTMGAFEPWYAFYGGTLYSLAALVAVVIGGHTVVAYVGSFALAMAMAFGGFSWLAKQAGVRGWPAHVAGFFFVASAYYMTDIYARGAWPETMATSAIPLLVASALALLRAECWRVGPVVAFVFAVVIFTGSHNITLLYGTIFLILLCVALVLAFGRDRLPPLRRVLAVCALGLLAAAVNLWFLLPDVAYEGRTVIGQSFGKPPEVTGGLSPLLLLDPFRHSRIPGLPTFDLQLPVLVLAWSVAALAIGWTALADKWRRLALALAIPAVPFLAVLLFPALWKLLPRLLWAIQFPYRLITYVDYCVAALAILAVIAIVAKGRGRGRTALILAGVLIASLEAGQSIFQEWSTPSSLPNRADVFPGGSNLPGYWVRFATYLEFQDVSLPVLSATIPEIPGVTVYNGQGANVVPVPVTERPRNGYAVTLTPPHDGTVTTDVISGPYLVAVHGAKFVGRTPYSELVMRVNRNSAGGPTRVTFSTARTWPIVLGKWLTLLAVVVLALGLAGLAIRTAIRRARGDSSQASPRPPPPS
jgi:hypothetical protein